MTKAAMGAAQGSVRQVLRLEALTVLVGSIATYFLLGGNPWLFALLFFVPDLSFIGFAINARIGAVAYNTLHSYIGPALVAGLGIALGLDLAWHIALILVAHAAFDRSLGYGLKYAEGFSFTHLGKVGKGAH